MELAMGRWRFTISLRRLFPASSISIGEKYLLDESVTEPLGLEAV